MPWQRGEARTPSGGMNKLTVGTKTLTSAMGQLDKLKSGELARTRQTCW